ncbi:MAG: DMT family transporter [Ilumatobacteraceae bacterium]
MLKNQRVIGTALVMMSSLGFSIGPTLAKYAYDAGTNALGVMTIRFTIASVFMLVARQILMRQAPLPSFSLLLEMFAVGALGITTVSFTYFLAIEDIDTGLAIVIWYCNPLVVVFISWIIYKKRPSRNIVVSLFFSITGIAITAGQVKSGSRGAITLIFVSEFLFAFYLLGLSHTIKKTDLLTGVTFINIGASLGYWLICAILPFDLTVEFPSNTKSWLYIGAFALFGTVVPFMFSFAGMKRVGPSMLSVITTIEPILAIMMGIIFLSEPLTTPRVIGAIFVIGALIALTMLESRDEAALERR